MANPWLVLAAKDLLRQVETQDSYYRGWWGRERELVVDMLINHYDAYTTHYAYGLAVQSLVREGEEVVAKYRKEEEERDAREEAAWKEDQRRQERERPYSTEPMSPQALGLEY